jgi:hypothetical protein
MTSKEKERKSLEHVQRGICAICRRRQQGHKKLALDHDHKTGETRGLLCFNCNTGLGSFADDPRRLAAAIEYLGYDLAEVIPL